MRDYWEGAAAGQGGCGEMASRGWRTIDESGCRERRWCAKGITGQLYAPWTKGRPMRRRRRTSQQWLQACECCGVLRVLRVFIGGGCTANRQNKQSTRPLAKSGDQSATKATSSGSKTWILHAIAYLQPSTKRVYSAPMERTAASHGQVPSQLLLTEPFFPLEGIPRNAH